MIISWIQLGFDGCLMRRNGQRFMERIGTLNIQSQVSFKMKSQQKASREMFFPFSRSHANSQRTLKLIGDDVEVDR